MIFLLFFLLFWGFVCWAVGFSGFCVLFFAFSGGFAWFVCFCLLLSPRAGLFGMLVGLSH